jgi:pimeloyl-ACP methyl ester carboxylesterase
MSRDTGGLLVETHRRSPVSQLKTALIFPGSLGKMTEDTLARAYKGQTILSCTTSSGYQVGLLFGAGQPSAVQPSPPAPETCYLVYFYGNGMCLQTSCYEFAQFRQLGWAVLIPEYPGYGMSSGWASESGCYEAADAAYHYLTETIGAHPTQIVVAGWSLGAAVAIDLAARKQVAGLIVLGAFTNIPEQAHAMLPWVPTWVVRLFIRERFDNLSKIRRVTCPIFIGHGTQDELVPFAMAERLAQAARPRNPVTFLPIQGCSHNGIFEANRGCVWTAIRDFLSNLWQVDAHTDERSGTVSWDKGRVR